MQLDQQRAHALAVGRRSASPSGGGSAARVLHLAADAARARAAPPDPARRSGGRLSMTSGPWLLRPAGQTATTSPSTGTAPPGPSSRADAATRRLAAISSPRRRRLPRRHLAWVHRTPASPTAPQGEPQSTACRPSRALERTAGRGHAPTWLPGTAWSRGRPHLHRAITTDDVWGGVTEWPLTYGAGNFVPRSRWLSIGTHLLGDRRCSRPEPAPPDWPCQWDAARTAHHRSVALLALRRLGRRRVAGRCLSDMGADLRPSLETLTEH